MEPNKPFDQSKQNLDQGGKSTAHKVGDKIERFGEKVSNAGAPKTGKAIYDAGNKIEHMGEKKR